MRNYDDKWMSAVNWKVQNTQKTLIHAHYEPIWIENSTKTKSNLYRVFNLLSLIPQKCFPTLIEITNLLQYLMNQILNDNLIFNTIKTVSLTHKIFRYAA